MTPDNMLVPGALFAAIFDPEAAAGPDLAVNYEVWNRIYHSVPEDYKLPDLPIVTLRLPVVG
ncbi:hypothetical protein [Cohnella hashimotonis]|uniref:Uncharacterized protein n=1 Tax=Cohnella hashimotonis TaxID=2826895 RepID=A0ABT6TJ95_9BACL|nr:hypothetical protein [Cohnella hashimotonis]MDI4646014.1 hypothetical protein [Cohnella hashimotonis]